MIRSGWFAVLAVVLASLPCKAQFGAGVEEKEYPVQVEMEGGQCVQGKLRLAEVLIDCELGQYQIKAEKVKMIRFPNPGAEATGPPADRLIKGTVITTSDREIHGLVHVRNWTVETDLGSLTLKPETIKAVNFSASSPPPDGRDKKP
jgi:hypothetical protein